MKTSGAFLLLFLLSTNLFSQKQEIDSDITKIFKEVTGTCDFIEFLNSYLSMELVDEVHRKEFDEYVGLCRSVNKKNIPLYEMRIKDKMLDFYFKKGKTVYNFSLEKKNDLYFSNVKCYSFKNRKIKKQGRMAFKA